MNEYKLCEFCTISPTIYKQVKVASPEESGRIVSHENVYIANGNYERRKSKLGDENANC